VLSGRRSLQTRGVVRGEGGHVHGRDLCDEADQERQDVEAEDGEEVVLDNAAAALERVDQSGSSTTTAAGKNWRKNHGRRTTSNASRPPTTRTAMAAEVTSAMLPKPRTKIARINPTIPTTK